MLTKKEQEMYDRLKKGHINWWKTSAVETIALNGLTRKGFALKSLTGKGGKPIWSISEKQTEDA